MGVGGWLAERLDVLPAPLVVFLLALSPVGEVRVAIPVAMLVLGMGWAEAFTWALLGNLLVIPLALWFYPMLEKGVRHWDWADRALDRIYARTRRKVDDKIRRYEEYAVFLLIATPLPGTGAWTGALAGHLFALPFRKAAGFYYAGIVAACFLVVIFVQLGVWGFRSV